jgi:hypothetical protein
MLEEMRVEVTTRYTYEQQQVAAPTYPDDPVGFIRKRLGESLWSKQAEIAEAVPHHRRVAVQSAHGMGKSWLAARIVAWWLSQHDPGDAFVVTTAPSGPQVRAILWREIGRAHARGGLAGRVTQTEWWMQAGAGGHGGHEEMVAFGRKPSDYDPAAFQGIHARYVLVIIDEAAGVPETLFDAAKSLTTNEGSRILAIGNPDDPASYFCATVLKPDSGWHLIHVDGLKSPNFENDEDVSDDLRSLLLAPVWVEEARRDWGEGSPLWQSKVRGLVPEDTSDGVIPLSWLKRCQEEREWKPEQLLPVELGVDVGAGGDWTVVRERRGVKAGRTWRAQTPESYQAVALIMEAIRETGATSVKVDAIGVGWGICGALEEKRELGEHSAEIVAVNVAIAALTPERYYRLRDQMWWELGRELSETGGWDLAELDDQTLAQLIAPTYKDFSGVVKVEKKEDTKKRLGRSPDDADALLNAYYVPPPEPVEGVLVYDEPVGISPV